MYCIEESTFLTLLGLFGAGGLCPPRYTPEHLTTSTGTAQ